MATFLVTVFLDVDMGLLVGLLVSIIFLISWGYFPKIEVIGITEFDDLFLQGDQYNKVPTFSLNSICKFLFFQINKSYDQLCREELSLRVNIFISKNYEAKLVLNPFMSIYMQLWVYLSPFTSSEKQSCLGGCK